MGDVIALKEGGARVTEKCSAVEEEIISAQNKTAPSHEGSE